MFAGFGPNILRWTVNDSVYPALMCLSAASSRVRNGGQHSYTEGGYKPTWEGPTPCKMISKRSSSRAIWGQASPTQSQEHRLLRADLILAFNIFEGEVDVNPSEFFCLPTDCCKDQATFDAGALPSLPGYWNFRTDSQHMLVTGHQHFFSSQLFFYMHDATLSGTELRCTLAEKAKHGHLIVVFSTKCDVY